MHKPKGEAHKAIPKVAPPTPQWQATGEATKAPLQPAQGYATIDDLKNLSKEFHGTIEKQMEKQMAALMEAIAAQTPAAPAAREAWADSLPALAATAANAAASSQAPLARQTRGRPTSAPANEDRERSQRGKARKFLAHETALNLGATRLELEGRIKKSIGNAPTRLFSRAGATVQQ